MPDLSDLITLSTAERSAVELQGGNEKTLVPYLKVYTRMALLNNEFLLRVLPWSKSGAHRRGARRKTCESTRPPQHNILFVLEPFHKVNNIRVYSTFFIIKHESYLCIGQLHTTNNFQFTLDLVGKDSLFKWFKHFKIPT